MIGRTVLVKVGAFALITLLGVGYVLVHYLGVAGGLVGSGFTAYADLADSGGLFTTASVTYRGVEVGRVGAITLRPGGIRVALDFTADPHIPADLRAVVGDGSVIGEQFIDLQPLRDSGPYLHSGSVIPASRTTLPVTTQQMLVDLDQLVRSVPRQDLRTVIDQLGAGFADTGPALRQLLDATHTLVATATADLPATSSLIAESRPVLDTQNLLSDDIVAFSHDLAQFSTTLRAADPALRAVLANGVPAATQLTQLVNGVDATLPVLLGNLVSVGQVAAVRIPALRQILVIYPYVVATSFGLFPGNGQTQFGVPLPPSTQSQPCATGYLPPSQRRLPSVLTYPPIRYGSFCKAPLDSQTDVRGSREAPEPDGKRLGQEPGYFADAGLPGGTGTASTAGTRQMILGSTGGEQALLGGSSFAYLLLGPLG